MKRLVIRCATALLAGAVLAATAAAQSAPAKPLQLMQTVAMPGVEGRIDHMAVDLKGKRLIVAALATDRVDVYDLAGGKALTHLNVKQPAGVAYLADMNLIVAESEGDNNCQFFDGESYKLVTTVDALPHADNVRYDAGTKRLYVGYGDGGDSGMGIIDAKLRVGLGDINLEGHPEAFSLEAGGGRRIYVAVNASGGSHVAVLDTSKRRVMEKWTIPGVQAFYAVAFDEADHRLFVASRNPPKMSVFDTQSGKVLMSLDGPADADDISYDAAHKRVYMVGGEGVVSVFQQLDADHYQLLAKVPTARGAKTALWVPEMNRLFVAVPRRGQKSAEVQAYEPEP